MKNLKNLICLGALIVSVLAGFWAACTLGHYFPFLNGEIRWHDFPILFSEAGLVVIGFAFANFFWELMD